MLRKGTTDTQTKFSSMTRQGHMTLASMCQGMKHLAVTIVALPKGHILFLVLFMFLVTAVAVLVNLGHDILVLEVWVSARHVIDQLFDKPVER